MRALVTGATGFVGAAVARALKNAGWQVRVLARSGSNRGNLEQLAVEVAEGDLVENRYRVVRAIGAGGMGIVYEVRRTSDEFRLALKVLTGRQDDESRERNSNG